MNGKGDKQRVNWSKDYESKYDKIFKKEENKMKNDYFNLSNM